MNETDEKTRPQIAFYFDESIVPIRSISKGLLLDIAKTTIPMARTDDDLPPENKAVTKLGFLCAEITNHPDRTENVIGPSFSMIDISDESVTLLVNLSLLRPLGEWLVRSQNKAVAKLGFDCLRQHERLDNRSRIE